MSGTAILANVEKTIIHAGRSRAICIIIELIEQKNIRLHNLNNLRNPLRRRVGPCPQQRRQTTLAALR